MHNNDYNELLPIVDENGNTIGKTTRSEAHGPKRPLHPVVHLHLFNSQGKLYLQRRPLWKDVQPGKWDTSVGGHIDFGETVEEALAREAREELGLSLTTTVPLYTYIHRSDKEAEYVNTFATVCNPTEITINYNEISEGLFFEMQTIESLLQTGCFTPNFELEFQRLKEQLPFIYEHFSIK